MEALPAINSLLDRSEVRPLLWLGGFAVFLLLHLMLHPQSRFFLRAIAWMGKHPAPVLLFAASVMLARGVEGWTGNVAGESGHSVLHDWPGVWAACLAEGVTNFALIFHTALIPPAWSGHPLASAAIQALVSAFSQVWLCCYLLFSLGSLEQEWLAMKETLLRWRSVLLLALCHLPWWWMEGQPSLGVPGRQQGLVLEFLLFLAPFPLAVACTCRGILAAGSLTLRCWQRAWLPLLGFALTALPLLTVLAYTTRTSAEVLPPDWKSAGVLLEGLILATVHVWLFVSAAMIMLPPDLRELDPIHADQVLKRESSVEG